MIKINIKINIMIKIMEVSLTVIFLDAHGQQLFNYNLFKSKFMKLYYNDLMNIHFSHELIGIESVQFLTRETSFRIAHLCF